MSELLKNLSSYNIFNYLLPGVVFCVLTSNLFSLSLIQSDVVVGVFFYYFAGLVISRVGSIIVGPILKKIGFLSFASYSDFISAAKEDPKIEILSQENNMYRTILSMMLLIAFTGGYCFLKEHIEVFDTYSTHLIIAVLIILFALAYKKQTQFIKSRVAKAIDEASN